MFRALIDDTHGVRHMVNKRYVSLAMCVIVVQEIVYGIIAYYSSFGRLRHSFLNLANFSCQ